MSGIAEVIVQSHPVAGTLILLAILIHSWQMAISAFFATAIATGFAILIKKKQKIIALGLYGYNATLIGIAFVYLYQVTYLSIFILFICSILSVYISLWIPAYLKVPTFTAPFVLITWLVIGVENLLHLLPAGNVLNFNDNIYTLGLGEAVGQVYLQGNGITGVIILLAIVLYAKSDFIWAMAATCLAWLIAHTLNYPAVNIENGLYGFSAVLTAIALQNIKPLIFPISGIIITVFVTQAFILIGWPSLTAPFVIVSWLVILTHRFYLNQSAQS
ncbi:MAG: urea transporter [Gammaproteobacteria bacterium]|nr:urea transporter [Gammaproteobacteria bacterium]